MDPEGHTPNHGDPRTALAGRLRAARGYRQSRQPKSRDRGPAEHRRKIAQKAKPADHSANHPRAERMGNHAGDSRAERHRESRTAKAEQRSTARGGGEESRGAATPAERPGEAADKAHQPKAVRAKNDPPPRPRPRSRSEGPSLPEADTQGQSRRSERGTEGQAPLFNG